MCDVGRIKHHLKHNLWNPNSTILFVGYQAEGTLGNKIVNGAKKVKIFGEEIAVNARIEYIEGYSGHADQEWLLNFVYSFITKPKHIFLVHGEKDAKLELKNKLEENTQIPITIPKYGERYTLNEELAKQVIKRENDSKFTRLEVLGRMETLKEEIDDMEEIIKEELSNNELQDEDVVKMNDRIKDLERRIVEIIENK